MVYSGVITGQNFRGKNGAGHQEHPEPVLEHTVSRDTEDTFTPNTRLDECGPLWGERE